MTAGARDDEFVIKQRAAARSETTVELPEGCQFVDEGQQIICPTALPLSWAVAGDASPTPTPTPGPGGSAQEALVSARTFLRVLRDTRRQVVTRNGKRLLEPLGVTVSFEAVVAGYRGRDVDVRWSLYRTSSGRPIGRDWLVNRRVLSFKPSATVQRVSQDFWVPLPRRRASSFIRVTLYGPDGSRITRRDTKRFR